jgi:UDP-glucose:(heptosyl)LPS alpha-1,3-glucosyltransferase
MMELEVATFTSSNTGRIIVNSEMVKREILDHFTFPENRIHLVRNGVDTRRFENGNRTETRAKFGVKNHECLLLFVGSGWERKGLRYLLDALRSPALAHGKFKLLVVGKGHSPGSPPKNAIFAGAMPAIEDAYAAADVFVFPAIYEPSSNVVIEALAAGLPVITSAHNGASEMIHPKLNGTVLRDPSDIDAISQAILQWQAGRSLVEHSNPESWDLTRNVTETLAVLELAARERA